MAAVATTRRNGLITALGGITPRQPECYAAALERKEKAPAAASPAELQLRRAVTNGTYPMDCAGRTVGAILTNGSQ